MLKVHWCIGLASQFNFHSRGLGELVFNVKFLWGSNMLCYVHRTSSREIFTISSQMKEFNDNVQISNMFLLGKLQACPDFKTNILLFSMGVDCTQPPIFSYFYSIAELTGRIERELHASPKRETASFCVRWKIQRLWTVEFFSVEGRGGLTTVKQYSDSTIRFYSSHQSYTLEMKSIYLYLACLKCCPKHCQHLHVSMLVSVIDRLACAWGKD